MAIRANVPSFIWGPPGVGKTSFTESFARKLSIPIETIIASLRAPTDFAGLPVLSGNEVFLAPPSWAKRLAAIPRPDGPDGQIGGILFIDEITSAPPAVQSALLRVILDGVVGDLILPPWIAKVAAANPPDQAAGGWDLAQPLLNRFFHLDWELDPINWAEGFVEGFVSEHPPHLPPNWTEGLNRARMGISAFIKKRPQALLKVPGRNGAKAFPTPRSWEMFSRLIAAGTAVEADFTAFGEGSVGTGPTLEFLSWCMTREENAFPEAEELLNGKKSAQDIINLPPELLRPLLEQMAFIVAKAPLKNKVLRALILLREVWDFSGEKDDLVFLPVTKILECCTISLEGMPKLPVNERFVTAIRKCQSAQSREVSPSLF